MTLLKKVKKSSLLKHLCKILRPSKEEKANTGVFKETSSGNELQFDAVPQEDQPKGNDISRGSPHLSEQGGSFKDYEYESDNNFPNVQKETNPSNKKTKRSNKKSKQSKFASNEEESSSSSDEEVPNDGKPSVITNEYHIVVNGSGSSGFHFGNTRNITQVNNISVPSTYSPIVKKSPAVKSLLKSKDNLHRKDGEFKGHLQFLAQHIGKQWRKIGKSLDLTSEDLENIKINYNEREEKSYQMLKVWCEKQTKTLTVGSLCKSLWDTNIPEAQEAISKLGENIHDIE